MRIPTILIGASLLISAGLFAAEVAPVPERGFKPESVYQVNGVDTVSVFSTSLSLVIPVGQRFSLPGGTSYGLNLVWNSQVWDYEQTAEVFQVDCYLWETKPCTHMNTQAFANRTSNAGMGWMLGFGWLRSPGKDQEIAGNLGLKYTDANGGEHSFWSTLHDGDTDDKAGVGLLDVFFTRDGSYLRLMCLDSNNPISIEFPDGQRHSFLCYDECETFRQRLDKSKWRLSTISDRFGNYVSIDYSHPNEWWITDTFTIATSPTPRRHIVYFTDSYDYDGQERSQVDKVKFYAADGSLATYQFAYQQSTISRSCRDTFTQNSVNANVPLLISITLPDHIS